jgi:hypothetical protein
VSANSNFPFPEAPWPGKPRLSVKQADLLTAVCLKRYTVTYFGYMGSFRPNATVEVEDAHGPPRPPVIFRPATLEALAQRGLVRTRIPRGGDARGPARPTPAGMDYFIKNLKADAPKAIRRINEEES